jgi:hypothetical protein
MTYFNAVYKDEFILLIARFFITYIILSCGITRHSKYYDSNTTHIYANTHFMNLIQH